MAIGLFETALILKLIAAAACAYAAGFGAGKSVAWIRAIGSVV